MQSFPLTRICHLEINMVLHGRHGRAQSEPASGHLPAPCSGSSPASTCGLQGPPGARLLQCSCVLSVALRLHARRGAGVLAGSPSSRRLRGGSRRKHLGRRAWCRRESKPLAESSTLTNPRYISDQRLQTFAHVRQGGWNRGQRLQALHPDFPWSSVQRL